MVSASEKDVFTPELLDLLETILAFQNDLSTANDFLHACKSMDELSVPCLSQRESGKNANSLSNLITTRPAELGLDSVLQPNSVSPCGKSHEGEETSCSTATEVLSPLERSGSGNPVASGYMDLPTTLMLKNIPNRVTREQLVGEVLSRMPQGSFDFLYLPNDFKTRAGFGYAFINLTSGEAVDLFLTEFNKKRLQCASGIYSKPLEVSAARVQGFTANVNRLISSPVLFSADEGSLPLIFNGDQVQISFKALMQLNRASVLFQTRPSIEELMAMVEAELLHNSYPLN